MMAQVIKETTTLQGQAKNEWTKLGVIWLVAIISFFLPNLVKGSPYASFIPIIVIAIALRLSWKSLIIIRGNKGEKRVFDTLLQLPDDYKVLNDVVVKVGGKEAQLDHLLVSPYGLWSVETKSHLGRIYGKESDKNWTQKKKSDRGKIYTTKFYNPVAQNRVHCKRLQDLLKEKLGQDIPVKSVVVFTSADQLNIESNTPVVTLKALVGTIHNTGKTVVLSDENMTDIINAVS